MAIPQWMEDKLAEVKFKVDEARKRKQEIIKQSMELKAKADKARLEMEAEKQLMKKKGGEVKKKRVS